MSYEPVNDVPFKSMRIVSGKHNNDPQIEEVMPSAVFRMDTGDLIAVHSNNKRLAELNTLSMRIVAWLVDAEGDAQALHGTDPIYVDYKHNAPMVQIETFGVSGLTALLRDMVFGEPVSAYTPIPASVEVLDAINIRYAILSARAAGEVVDLVTAQAPALLPPTE